ncbi:MAG: hypothetical protein VKL39_10045, partial [Leptolyngbyaceae bacterium]|nr:hypothetical protein [Leptolyngbyaceae bacterium]
SMALATAFSRPSSTCKPFLEITCSLFPASRWECPREPLAPVQLEPEAPATVSCQRQGTREYLAHFWRWWWTQPATISKNE